MPVADPKKTIDVSSMPCGGTATVTLSFETAASLALEPADILLMMDRSALLTGETMALAKTAAKQLIDMVDGARSGATRMGIVSYADSASVDVKLTDAFSQLKPAIDALTAGGTANHPAAWEAAKTALSIPTSQRQAAILFTASTHASGGADAVVQELKDKGLEVFCIGLGADQAKLELWASDPDRIHAVLIDQPAQLSQAFRKVGEEVVLAGVRDGVIQEQLTPDFKIVTAHQPDVGSVEVTGPQTLTWTIDAAGIKEQPCFVGLSFDIMHIGTSGGQLPVNQSVHYSDREGNALTFPSPTVEVTCSGGGELYPEPCPEPTVFTVPGCQDAVHVALDDAALQGLGRIVQLDATLKAVCPGKQVAVSILLSETTADGAEKPRGVKHILVPPQEGTDCRDITLKCIQFSLPEALDTDGSQDSICNERSFHARVIANYVDTDFACCQAAVQTV